MGETVLAHRRIDDLERAARLADIANATSAAMGSEEAVSAVQETIDALQGDGDLDYMLDPDAQPDNEALERLSKQLDQPAQGDITDG